MNKILLTCAAVGALAASAPAASQYSNVNAGGAVGISNQIAQLEQRLDAQIRTGRIEPSEANSLTAQMRDLRRLERSYSRNGLTVAERTTLLDRIRDMRQDIRVAARDTGYDQLGTRVDDVVRYDRYGNRDVNGMYDRSGNRLDTSATIRYDRYGNRDANGMYDRNGNRLDTTASIRYDRYGNRSATGEYDARGTWVGRVNEDVYDGRGGPYESVDANCENRGGIIGGVLNSVLGRGDTCGTLRVGARATSNLRTLPSEYRYRYPDGNGVYYRTDGQAIYQIDARTSTVIRVYSMER